MPNPLRALPRPRYADRIEAFSRWVERAGNRLPHPFFLFVLLALAVAVLSALLSAAGASTALLDTDAPTVHVRNLLSGPFLRDFVTRFVSIYADFPPLGLTMAMMIGVGVLDRSGLMSALMRRVLSGARPAVATALLAFVGINANLASGAGVVFTATIGGAVFRALGRNPWLGVVTGYAAASGGYCANLLVAGTDVLLSGITRDAASRAGLDAPVHPLMNWYFMIAATFVVTLTVTLVAERVVSRLVPDMEDPPGASTDAPAAPTEAERRGLWWAAIAALLFVSLVLLGTLPAAGPLRNPDGTLGPSSPLTEGSVTLLFFFFVCVGTAYGYGSGRITSAQEIPKLMEGGLRGVLGFLVVVLPAAVFVHFLNESKLSLIVAAYGSAWLQRVDLGPHLLVGSFILVVAFVNLFITSGSAKWLILAPVFVPIFASVDLAPATAQVAFRVGDSATNMASPLKSYLPVLLGLLAQYQAEKDTRPIGIGTVVALEVPFSIALLFALLSLLLLWVALGLPLGPGAPVRL